jgi:serine/threonine protein kinase
MQTISNAAENLEGTLLDTGWKVVKRIPKGDNSTGSFFSVCYLVEKNGETCFLKAFDFAKFFSIAPGKRVVDVISDMSTAFRYERDLSELCQNSRITKVAFVKESGEQYVANYTISFVPYLIFDLAEGDVRNKLSIAKKIDNAWKLNSLHSIAVGLKQLHAIGVSHQDLKPSNILIFDNNSKIGDLGRSISATLDSPFRSLPFSGDYNYAPPEILYGEIEPNLFKRTYLSDCYLLGSMIMFYFTGVGMSAAIKGNLSYNISWEQWQGSFDDVKHYLLQSFEICIAWLQTILQVEMSPQLATEITDVVKGLCYPLPEKRGHPKNLGSSTTNYNLERYVSKLNLLHNKARIEAINKR